MKKIVTFIILFVGVQSNAAMFKSNDGKEVQIKKTQRVVVINSSSVEIISELGFGDKIIAVDVGSQYPPDVVKDKMTLGHPYKPSAEGIISLNPDLVIANEENMPLPTAEQIRSAKIPVLILEHSAKNGVEGLRRRVKLLGDVFAVPEKALHITKNIDEEMARIDIEKKSFKKKPKVFFLYAHGAGSAFIYGKETGSHYLIETAGAENSADFTVGTKPLTAEAMVQASPDIIIMLGRGLKAVGGIDGALKLPGVALTPAGKKKAIIQVDDSIRWIGTRFPGFAHELTLEIKNLSS